MPEYTIRCRAQVHEDCLDGEPTRRQFGEDLPMDEDGTFLPDPGNGATDAERNNGSIVCDFCYIALMPLTPSGQALNHELGEAIEKAQAGR